MQTGGGTPEGAADAARRLIKAGANTLISFGLAGGLDPALRPGTVVIPASVLSAGRSYQANTALACCFGGLTPHCLLAGTTIAADTATKLHLHKTTGAHAIDLESGSVALIAEAHGLAFIAVRAICDPADRDLPPAALLALDPAGAIAPLRLLRSLLRQPTQLPALLRLAADAAHARLSLISLAERFLARSAGPADTASGDPATQPTKPPQSH